MKISKFRYYCTEKERLSWVRAGVFCEGTKFGDMVYGVELTEVTKLKKPRPKKDEADK